MDGDTVTSWFSLLLRLYSASGRRMNYIYCIYNVRLAWARTRTSAVRGHRLKMCSPLLLVFFAKEENSATTARISFAAFCSVFLITHDLFLWRHQLNHNFIRSAKLACTNFATQASSFMRSNSAKLQNVSQPGANRTTTPSHKEQHYLSPASCRNTWEIKSSKVEVKISLEQAKKAQRGRTSIALFYP